MFEHPGHFPGGRGHAGDRHNGTSVDLQHLVGSVVNYGVPGSRSRNAKKVRIVVRTATLPVTYCSAHPVESTCERMKAVAPDVRISGMKSAVDWVVLLLVVAGALAQSPQSSPSPAEMAALEKKIEQINTKIDALSQQILKLEQQVSRPGMIIGETTPGSAPSVAASASETVHPPASNGN